MSFFSRFFSTQEKDLKKFQKEVDAINALGDEMKALTDEEVLQKTTDFKDRLADGAPEDEILAEAFALVREVADRVIGERHYDTQLLGGIVLHRGKVAEMKTGEGKTLTSTLPVYLNALSGKGVHVVTVNDYLARRDCNWMGSVFHRLGLSTACITSEGGFLYEPKVVDGDSVSIEEENLHKITKKEAYEADITYGTNNEFGFDYLRDNMAKTLDGVVQRSPHYVVVDEVDSVLIDEARTPLIISAPDHESTQLYPQFASIIPQLINDEDYTVDEKERSAVMTDVGIQKVEEILGIGNIYEDGKWHYVHHLEQSLKAHIIFEKDKDYMLRGEDVIIVDEFTGRAMEGRRYSDGLHQAIEAKEGVPVRQESRTLATITFQNYFRMYKKIAGMTGTAMTSAEELLKVYELDVVEIPTFKDVAREDLADVIYKTERGKNKAIIEKIKELHEKGQPVLVGTVAIEKSEALSRALEKARISHSVLNAKQHEREAEIISNAGLEGAVTIATNMAGRGTDIKITDAVKEKGGLYIIGTERHEARRIDNQLRGRSGRQGDPGTTQFYISLEDELMRRFGGDRLKNVMEKLGLPEDQPIQNNIISKQIEGAQKRIEGFNFDIRKHVLDYDNVINKQREVIYTRRRSFLGDDSIKPAIYDMMREEVQNTVSAHAIEGQFEWNVDAICSDLEPLFVATDKQKEKINSIITDPSHDERESIGLIIEYLFGLTKEIYGQKESEVGNDMLRVLEKRVALDKLDEQWMNHIDAIDGLRQGIGLRGYGQRDPLIEFKKESFELFSHLVAYIRMGTLKSLFHIQAATTDQNPRRDGVIEDLSFSGATLDGDQFAGGGLADKKLKPDLPQIQKPAQAEKKLGRNDMCDCGCGKKVKKCPHRNS